MSRRALDFLTWAAASCDCAPGPGSTHIEIPMSQAELARHYGCTAGTVAYYLRRAGDVVTRSRTGLVIDRAALERATSAYTSSPAAPATRSRHLRLAPPTAALTPSAPPALSGTHVVDVVSALAHCLTQVSTELSAVASQLLGALDAPANPAIDPRTFADPPANVAGFAGGSSLKSVPRKEGSLPSSLEPAGREVRGCTAQPDPPASTALPFALVDELVAPLRAYARRTGRPDSLDDNGRQLLAVLSEPELRHGVQRAQREAEVDSGVRKPVGLLVHKAREARDYFAAPPTPAPRPAPVVDEAEAPTDDEAAAAVAALEEAGGEALARLDAEVQRWLQTNVANERLRELRWRRSRRGLRQEAWRRSQPDVEVAADELAAG